MAARTQRHRLLVDWSKGGSSGVPHCSRRVVHGAEEHSCKGKRDVVLWFGVGAPFAPLHPANSFSTDHVGPRAGHGDLFLPTVKIDEHFTFGGFAANFMVEVDQQLIVALHEVDFDSLDAPLSILIESRDQLIVERLPNHPKNDSP